jgi:hypothetical protein
VVTGELLKIEGTNYTVKDLSGKEVRFQIDPSRTMMNTQPKVGDKIRANVEPQGYAFSIDRAEWEAITRSIGVRLDYLSTLAASDN